MHVVSEENRGFWSCCYISTRGSGKLCWSVSAPCDSPSPSKQSCWYKELNAGITNFTALTHHNGLQYLITPDTHISNHGFIHSFVSQRGFREKIVISVILKITFTFRLFYTDKLRILGIPVAHIILSLSRMSCTWIYATLLTAQASF